MATVAELVQYLGQFDGNSSLENVLRKEETHPFFQKIYDLLRPVFGQSRSQRESRTKPASTALGDILGLKNTDLTLRGRFFDRFCEIQRTPSLFWRSLVADDSPWAARASPDVIVGKAYVASQGVCADRQWQTVRWRFYTVFFYRLAYLYGNGASKISDKAKARLLDAIRRSNLVHEDSKVTKEQIEKMVSKGSRYTKFCQELWKKEHAEGDMLKDGYGPLFFLPSIADNIWEDRRKLQAKEFDDAVLHLYNIGITEQSMTSGASFLAKEILNIALKPFTWNADNRGQGKDTNSQPHALSMVEPTASASDTLSRGVRLANITDFVAGASISMAGTLGAVVNPGADLGRTKGIVSSIQCDKLSTTNPILHRPSEQIFYRVPLTIPYESPIFIHVQNGNIGGIRELFRLGHASIDVVDPYGLGLLFYGAYYCWRNCGMEAAMSTCKELLEAGANARWLDDIGNTPMDTMVDVLLVEAAMRNQPLFSYSFKDLGRLFGKPIDDIWEGYLRSRGFTVLHEVLLHINNNHGTLNDYLLSITAEGTAPLLIDYPDGFGRSALSWAVEFGWVDAVETLVRFGANVNQYTSSGIGGSPLLHCALAGPACGQSNTEFLSIVRTLLEAGADVNAVDHEGWTPLHIAASWNSQHAVAILSNYKRSSLNWRAVTNDGKSAAQLAKDSGGDQAFVLGLLGPPN